MERKLNPEELKIFFDKLFIPRCEERTEIKCEKGKCEYGTDVCCYCCDSADSCIDAGVGCEVEKKSLDLRK